MKQKGTIWRDFEGQDVPVKYLPDYPKKAEFFASGIEEMADKIMKTLRDGRKSILDYCNQMREIHLKENPETKVFTFYSFDKQVRIEYDYKQAYVRVYKATRDNPTSKDYKLLVMEFNAIEVEEEFTDLPTPAETTPAPAKAVVFVENKDFDEVKKLLGEPEKPTPNDDQVKQMPETISESSPFSKKIQAMEDADNKHIDSIKNAMREVQETDEQFDQMALARQDDAPDGPKDDTEEESSEQLNLKLQ